MPSAMRVVAPVRIHIAFWLVGTLLVGAGAPPSAGAYVPPARQLLQSMRQALGQTEALAVDQRVSVFTGDGAVGGNGLFESLKYEFPDRFRSEIHTGSSVRVSLVAGDLRLTVADGQIAAEAQGRYDLYKDVLLYNVSPLFERRLTSLGLDADVVSLGRLNGRLVYVVGGRYPDPAGCQLWLDKESLRPVRWLIPPQGDPWTTSALDIRYTLWQPAGSIWYPRQVLFYQDGTLVRRIDVERVEIRRGFPEDLFDIDRLRYSVTRAAVVNRAPPSTMGEIEQAIENFHRLYTK